MLLHIYFQLPFNTDFFLILFLVSPNPLYPFAWHMLYVDTNIHYYQSLSREINIGFQLLQQDKEKLFANRYL